MRGRLTRAVISDGCVIVDAQIDHAVIGIRSRIDAGATLQDVIIMGHDDYETPAEIEAAARQRVCPRSASAATPTSSARSSTRMRASGKTSASRPHGKPEEFDGEGYYVRDGIVVVPKGGRDSSSGTVL